MAPAEIDGEGSSGPSRAISYATAIERMRVLVYTVHEREPPFHLRNVSTRIIHVWRVRNAALRTMRISQGFVLAAGNETGQPLACRSFGNPYSHNVLKRFVTTGSQKESCEREHACFVYPCGISTLAGAVEQPTSACM